MFCAKLDLREKRIFQSNPLLIAFVEYIFQRSQEAFDMLMALKKGREQCASDLQGKYQATDIDSTALGLNEQSSGLSYIR